MVINNNLKAINKRGQVTIFIIIALVIVFAVALLVFLRSKATNTNQEYRSEENPNRYIRECVNNPARDKVSLILSHGGYINPKLNISFNGTTIAYLCYNSLYYAPCVNQEPMYIQHLEEEIKESISQDVEDCFSTLEQDYNSKKIFTQLGETKNITVSLDDKKVIITVSKEMKVTNKEETKSYDDFKIIFNSPAYNLARVAMDMVSGEATFCHNEYSGYQTLYPWVRIRVTDIKSASKIYEIEDKATGEKLNMAVRSCAIPMGLG